MSLFRIYNPTVNLELHTGGDRSPLEDWITFFFKGPVTTSTKMSVQIISPLGSAIFRLPVENRPQPVSTQGLASILEVDNAVADLLGRDRFAGLTDQDRLNARIATKTWLIPTDLWQYLAIPKRQFVIQNDFDWTDVTHIGFLYGSGAAPNLGTYCVSDLLLVGGGKDNSGGAVTPPGANGIASDGGLQGTYKYKLTYLNSVTGNRSNGSPATQVAEDVNRSFVTLSNIPTSVDSQVDFVEIFRTVGNGSRFFKIGEVANGTTTFEDQVADHDSLDSGAGIAVMTTLELPTDNEKPRADFDQALIDKMTAFWITNTTGDTGRVFYSPIGRIESVKGFIDVTRVGDPLHRLVVLNGQRFVFSESKVYRIDGNDPYTTSEIGGVPGVRFVSRRTVVATPFGIIYQAADGIRIFNGLRSELLNFDPIGKLFRGESAEGLPAFEGTAATFARGEYLVTNGSRTLAANLEDTGWRDVGFNDIVSLLYEWGNDIIVGGRTSNTQLLEQEGVFTDAGSPIPFEYETPAVDFPNDVVLIIDHAFVDIDPQSTTVTVTLVDRFGSTNLGTVSGASRETVEFPINEMRLKPSLRFSGSGTARVTLNDAELDVDPLQLGINLFNGSRVPINGRYREDLSTDGSIVFRVLRNITEFDQTDRLFRIERLTVEIDTQSQNVTPIITLENSAITLSTINTSTRDVVEIDLYRFGPLNELRFDGPFFDVASPVQIYRVELHVREASLGINITTQEQVRPGTDRFTLPLRSVNPTTSLVAEVQPGTQLLNNQDGIWFIERILVEHELVSTVSIEIDTEAGTTISAGTLAISGRDYTEFIIQRAGPPREVRLLGDFTANNRIYSVELYVRPVNLGIQFRSGQRIIHDGRLISPATQMRFTVDPDRHEIDGAVNVPIIEFLLVNINSNGQTVVPVVTTELGTITLNSLSNSTRETVYYDLHEVGNIIYVDLNADFTEAIELYSIESIIDQLPLSVRILENG